MSWLRGHRVALKYALIAALLIGGLVWLDRAGVLDRWAQAVDPWLAELAGLGVAGAFLLGLLGNSSLFLQVPYTVPMLAAALAGAPLAYLTALAMAAAIGATCGELVSYGVADAVLRHRDLQPSRLFRWVQRTVAEHPRTIPWLVLGFAITPLPDDAVLFPLAMVSYGARRLVGPLLAGKLGYCAACAVLFDVLGQQAGRFIPAHTTTDLALVGLVGFFVLIAYQVESGRAREQAGSVTSEPTREGSTDGTRQDRTGRGLRAG